MRFSGILAESGLQLVERSLIPACQKTGKLVYILLSNDTISFVQDENEAGGMIVTAKVKTECMFDRSSFVCTSKAHDLICIRMSLEVLLKSLKSGSSHGVERVGMALRHRPLKASLEGSAAVPLVEVWWKNECITTSQEIPIERPCAAAEVERICGLCQGSDVPCDFYVDILPELKPIMGILECVRNMSKCVMMCVTMDGDVHLVAEAGLSKVGVAFPCFDVFSGDGTATHCQVLPSQLCSVGIEERLEQATQQQRAQSMEVLVNHFHQVLKSIQVTNPVRIMCGMSTDLRYMHVVPSYKRETSSIHDDVSNAMALDYKIPAMILENE